MPTWRKADQPFSGKLKCAMKICCKVLLPLLLVLTLPAVVQAQYYYAITNGTVTITGYYGSGGAVTIPNTISGLPVTSIGDRAFYEDYYGGYHLTSITISNSVTKIGYEAFGACFYLTNATIGNSVTTIGDYGFANCTSLASVTLGSSVTNIGDYAFAACSSLASVTLGSSVTSIGSCAFNYCTSLTSVAIPNRVTSIGSYAFNYCASLTSVAIPNRVTSIGSYAFSHCTSLTSATIGSGVTSIGVNAFYTCENLTGVYFRGNAPSAVSPLFNGDDNVTVYYLPGTTGWDTPFVDLPPVLWNPQVQTSGASFGVRTNRFGFTITGTSGLVVVVEACTNPVNPAWSPLQTITLAGSYYFTDPQWTNYPARFYRISQP